jgi:hypothetical protein
VQSGLQQQALSQQMSQFLQALQFQQQQAAMQNSQSLSTLFGSAPGGNWSQWPISQSMQPLPGTQTQQALAQQMQNALGAASVTGQFANPSTQMYAPGTFIRNSDTGAIGQVQQNGGVRTFGSMQEYLGAGGTQDAVLKMPQLSQAEYGNLGTTGQPTQPTLQASQLTGMYQGAPTAAYQQQIANMLGQGAQLTGTYYDPAQMRYQPGTFVKDAGTGGIGQVQPNGQLRMFGSMDEYTAAGGTREQLAGLPSVPDAQYYQMATQGQTPGQQTLQSINQAAQLSGMYNGAPTEAASEYSRTLAQQMQQFQQSFGLQQGQLTGQYNGAPTEAASEFARNLALQQGQLGQQYLSTAAQLQGPQNTFQLSNYLRGAAANPNVPVYLQNLQNNMGMPSFQGTGQQAPTAASMGGLAAGMGYGSPASGTGTDTSGGATAGWNYGDTLNSIKGIASSGAQSLGPGSLERLSPDELGAFGSGLGAAGYSLPSFMQQYQNSRVGQQAPTAQTALA